MSQISLSPLLVAQFGSAITFAPGAVPASYQFTPVSPYNTGMSTMFAQGTISFLDASQTELINFRMYDTDYMGARTTDANGYVIWNDFKTRTPTASGTIEFARLTAHANYFPILLTVGDVGSGADVEIADRTITTAQPWKLTGAIKIRLPMSYTYTL